jgi:hypothetical protein
MRDRQWRIHPDKIQKYLLDEASANAAAKNRFFRTAGFTPEHWQVLELALLEHPRIATLEGVEGSRYGEKYVYRCNLPPEPNGKSYCVRIVWQNRDDAFWFVTAYPKLDVVP